MSTSRWCALLAALSLMGTTSPALAWPTLDASATRTSLLGGRWTIALGPDATTTAAIGDPRAPASRAELDGVAAMRAGEGQLAVRSTLLYATAPADLAAVVRALPAPCDGAVVAPFPGHDGVVAITCATPSPDGAFRPLVLFATHPDGWVDRLEVQLEVVPGSDTEGAIAFATAVAQTLAAGDAAPQVERGSLRIASACGGTDSFVVPLPDGWIATRLGNADLTVLQLLPVAQLGTPRPIASIGVSAAGTAPARIPAGLGTPHGDTLLGTPVEWLEVQRPEASMRELAVEVGLACTEGPWSTMVQLSAAGPSTSLDEATRILRGLAFQGDASHALQVSSIGTEEEPPPVVPSATQDELEEEEEATSNSHLWSMGIGGVSLLLLVLAVILRGRTTRPT